MRIAVILFMSVLGVAAQSAMPVIDVSVLAQAIKEVALAVQQLEQAKLELERLGDPARIVPPSARELIRSLSRIGEGKTLDEMQAVADGIASLSYAANGLYRAPGQIMYRADGLEVARDAQQYRKFDAVTQTRTTLETVLLDTEERRQQVRHQIQRTLNQLLTATTMAEVHKLQGILTAQNSELSAIDRERDAAAARVLVQQIENQSDAERQELAREEEHLTAFRQASDRLGQMLTPETSMVRIPDPNRP